ncbi:MAG TPA: sialidase family protein [bacterium]
MRILWEDTTPGNSDIFRATSTDGGSTFGAPVNLSATAANSTCYDWTSSGRAEFVAWTDAVSVSNSEIMLRRSLDGGGTFLPAVNLSANAGQSLCPAIEVAGGGLVYVVWTDNTSGNDEILLRRSVDGGATWTSAQNLSATGSPSANPKLAAFGPNLYVMWEEGTAPSREVYLRRSTNGGVTFGPAVNVSASAGDSFRPRFTVTGPVVYATYRDETPGNADIFLRTSTNGGVTFGSAANLSADGGRSTSQRIFVSGTFILVVWLDNTTGNDDVYLRRSTDGGATWEATKNLAANAGDTDSLDRSLGGTALHVIWDDSTPGNFDIFYRRSTNVGASFAAVLNLSGNSGASLNPQVVTSFRDLYVAWDDTTPGNREILFLHSANAGATFGLPAAGDGGTMAADKGPATVEWCVDRRLSSSQQSFGMPIGPCR